MEQIVYSQIFDILTELNVCPNSINFSFYLRDDVDTEAMKYALERFHYRFPYHAVKCVKREPNLVLVDNPEPYVLLEGDVLPVLGTEETNYHYFAFTYSKNRFSIIANHCLADGYVGARISKAVFYYYFRKKYNLKTRIDFYHEDPALIDPVVYKNMFDNFTAENVEIPFDPMIPREFLNLNSRNEKSPAKAFRCKINHDIYKHYAVSHGIGPGALFALLMNRALSKVHPNKENIKSVICVNPRDALGFPDALNSNVFTFLLGYYNQIKNKPIDEQMKICGRLVKDLNTIENIKIWSRSFKYMYDLFKTGKTFKEGIDHFEKAPKAHVHVPGDVAVSYMKMPFTDIGEEYIDTIAVCSSLQCHIGFEAIHFKDSIHITLGQGFSNDAYFKALLDEFDGIGIKYELMETISGDVSRSFFPID